MPHQYLQQHFLKELGPFRKHIFITFKLNYRFNRFEKNGKIWCWEMLRSFMQLKKKSNNYNKNQVQTCNEPVSSVCYLYSTSLQKLQISITQLFCHWTFTPTSPPGLNKTSHDSLSMSILGLAGKHAYKQTGKKSTEASLCFTWIWQLRSLLKKLSKRNDIW